MNIEEIKKIFEKRSETHNGIYYANIIDVIITMKSGCKITIFCDENTTTINCNKSHPNAEIEINDTLIEPMKDIKKIEVSWR